MIGMGAADIAGVGIFVDLSDADRSLIARTMRAASRRAGSHLIYEDDMKDDVYFVLDGILKVSVVSPNGRPIIYREFGPGDVIGDIAALDHAGRSADVIAVTDCVLAVMSGNDFRTMLAHYPVVAVAQMRSLALGFRRLSAKVAAILSTNADDRLRAELESLADAAGMINKLPTQAEIAARIGSQREVVNRIMKQLEQQGTIRREGRKLIIRTD